MYQIILKIIYIKRSPPTTSNNDDDDDDDDEEEEEEEEEEEMSIDAKMMGCAGLCEQLSHLSCN